MRPIRAQLRTGWKRMAGTHWITAGDGLRPEMDRTRKCIAARDGSRPEMDRGQRWIPCGDGSRQDMDLDRIWRDDRRWMAGNGSRETEYNQSPFLYEATKLQSSADLQTYGVPVAWLHRVQCQALLRALFRALFRDTESCTYMPEFHCRIRSRIRSRVTATMPIPHRPHEINHWRSNDL
jgi:hypothetical protein